MRLPAPLGEILDFLLPVRCLGCASPLPMDAPPGPSPLICTSCTTALREPAWPRCDRCHFPRGTGRAQGVGCLECGAWPPILHGARTTAILEPPADALVHSLKYGGWKGLAVPLGARMARLCPLPGHVVVPVPTTFARARGRGYNQAALLAESYASTLGSSVAHALERTREGPSQVDLPPERRRGNVKGVFRLRSDSEVGIRGRRIALIDDVLTTGATAAAAAEALERGGAAGVIVVTFARALPGRARTG